MSRLDRTAARMTWAGTATPVKELVSLANTTFYPGLIERPAAAFASGVPEGAVDDGFFGPDSVTWRMSADLASPVAGLRSLLMQTLHPLATAGVDQHSVDQHSVDQHSVDQHSVDQHGGWRPDPARRLAPPMAYLMTITFGDRATARQAPNRGRRIH